MVKYFRIFLLYFQYVLAHPSRSVVWTLIGLLDALIFLAFLRGVFQNNQQIDTWTLSTISSYYFVLIAAGSALMSKIEVAVLKKDNEQGEIDNHLLKPISYYWDKFYYEIPYRIFQGGIGIGLCMFMTFLFGTTLHLANTPLEISAAILIILLGFFVSFTFKLTIGIISFLTTDIRGLNELVMIVILLFSGYLIPVNLLPGILQTIALSLPFPYIVFYPVMAILGELSTKEILHVLIIQSAWLLGLGIVYKILWRHVVKHVVSLGR